jgi:hypothetical protein
VMVFHNLRKNQADGNAGQHTIQSVEVVVHISYVQAFHMSFTDYPPATGLFQL